MLKKKYLAVGMALILMAGCPAHVFGADIPRQTNIKVDGLLQKLEHLPMNVNGTILVEAEDLFRLLGITKYDIYPEQEKVIFYYQNKKVDMEVGRQSALVNDRFMALTVTPQNIDGYFYLPMRYVADRCNIPVTWKAETNTVLLDTPAKDYSVIGSVEKSIRKEPDVILSLQGAINKTSKTNNELTKLEETIKDAKDEVNDLKRIYDRLVHISLSDPLELPTREREIRSYEEKITSAEIQQRSIEKTKAFTIISSLNSLEQMQHTQILLEKQIALAEENIKNLELKQSLGMATETEIKKEKDDLAQNKISLGTLKKNIESAEMALNKAVEVPYEQTVQIDYTWDTTPLTVNDMASYLDKRFQETPSIQTKDQAYRYAAFIERNHYDMPQVFREAFETDETADRNLRNTKADLTTAKNDLEFKIRKAYTDLQLLDQEYQSLKIALDKAIDAYKSASIAYETGNGVIYTVRQAELALLQAEFKLDENRLSYALSKYKLENPMFL